MRRFLSVISTAAIALSVLGRLGIVFAAPLPLPLAESSNNLRTRIQRSLIDDDSWSDGEPSFLLQNGDSSLKETTVHEQPFKVSTSNNLDPLPFESQVFKRKLGVITRVFRGRELESNPPSDPPISIQDPPPTNRPPLHEAIAHRDPSTETPHSVALQHIEALTGDYEATMKEGNAAGKYVGHLPEDAVGRARAAVNLAHAHGFLNDGEREGLLEERGPVEGMVPKLSRYLKVPPLPSEGGYLPRAVV